MRYSYPELVNTTAFGSAQITHMGLTTLLRRDGDKASTSAREISKGHRNVADDDNDIAIPISNTASTDSNSEYSFSGIQHYANKLLNEAEDNLHAILADDTGNNANGTRIDYNDSDEDVSICRLREELRRTQLQSENAENLRSTKIPRKIKGRNMHSSSPRMKYTKRRNKPKCSLPSLPDILETLQAVFQCSDCDVDAPIPTVVDPNLNEDECTVGELTLLTLEREQNQKDVTAAQKAAASITNHLEQYQYQQRRNGQNGDNETNDDFIDMALNDDVSTVGELTLLTIEREQFQEDMMEAAQRAAASIAKDLDQYQKKGDNAAAADEFNRHKGIEIVAEANVSSNRAVPSNDTTAKKCIDGSSCDGQIGHFDM